MEQYGKPLDRKALGRVLAIFLLATVCAFSWNQWNRAQLGSVLPERIRAGATVATNDDVSYLRPAEDLAHGIKGERVGRTPPLRSPGYGLPYAMLRTFMDEAAALRYLAWLQVMLYAASAAFIALILHAQGIRGPTWTIVPVFAVMPMFQGFLFYTLTEAVTPAYVIFCVGCGVMYQRTGNFKWIWAGIIFWALLILTRPVLFWAGLSLVTAIWERDRKAIGRMCMVILLAGTPFLLWWIPESIRSGTLISPHPIYRPEALNVFRPTHKAFWELGKSWGMKGDELHPIMESGFRSGLECASVQDAAEAFMANAPAGHLTEPQRERIGKAFAEWGDITCRYLAPALSSGSPLHGNIHEREREVIVLLNGVTTEYRRQHPFHHHVVVPSRVLADMIFHSNLNLHIFQHTYRGEWWMETLRWICGGIHVLLIMAFFLLPWQRGSPTLRIAAIMALLYLLFLAYEQRGIEERYTLPVLHLSVLLCPLLFNRAGRPLVT